MTFSHQDIQDRLLDYLYEELAGAERAAFEAHLGTCAACAGEVAAVRDARAVARAVVRAPLEQPVPAALHARVMEAARRTGRSRTQTAEVTPAAVKRSALDWLRARWTLPMFATVAAMGVLLLGRETIFREARRPLGEAPPQSTSSPSPSASASATASDSTTIGAAGEPALEAGQEKSNATGASGATETPAAAARRRDAWSAPPAERTRKKSRATGNAGAIPVPARRSASDEEAPGRAPALPEQPAAARKADDSTAGLDRLQPARRSPAAPAREREPVAPPSERRPAKHDIADGLLDSLDSPAGAVAPAAAAAPMAAEAPAARAPWPPQASPPPPAVAPATSPGGLARSPGGAAPPPPDGDPLRLLADRADRAMRAARWPDAVAAYRELLRRYPDHPSAPTWRRQLAAAQAASTPAGDSRFANPPPAR